MVKLSEKIKGKGIKKLKIGWFSFSCCEDSTIVFTEMLNDHFEGWSKVVEIQYARVLRSKGKLEGLDVAFVEGAIASEREKKKLLEIRKNCKKLVAIGSCACTGGPSAQRNMFSKELEKEIEFLLRKFHQADKVHKLEDLVRVDAKVPGCPMSEERFLEVLNQMLKEFGVVK
jgi:coenzyme F420-reducing hydrogenase gamma subunit